MLVIMMHFVLVSALLLLLLVLGFPLFLWLVLPLVCWIFASLILETLSYYANWSRQFIIINADNGSLAVKVVRFLILQNDSLCNFNDFNVIKGDIHGFCECCCFGERRLQLTKGYGSDFMPSHTTSHSDVTTREITRSNFPWLLCRAFYSGFSANPGFR
jgi:hypothetical protein